MRTPLGYLDLVVEIVRGHSPILEYQLRQEDRSQLAKDHILFLRKQYPNGTSGNEMIDAVMEAGPDFLRMMWEQMSPTALTMCGEKNLNLLLTALKTIEDEKVPGDFIETGVWRGGLPIIMRAFLEDVKNRDRTVWIADSFRGLPEGSKDPNDVAAHLLLAPLSHLSVNRKAVEDAFDFFGLRDEQTQFLEGWFCDTLKNLPKKPLALVRLDGDYYESTRDAMEELYPRLSPGGYLIVDDYHLPLGCKRAIDEYRKKHAISDMIIEINSQSVYWRKG
jgi:hypothetical protein